MRDTVFSEGNAHPERSFSRADSYARLFIMIYLRYELLHLPFQRLNQLLMIGIFFRIKISF